MVNQESAATALAHLEMIFQAATGDYSPRPGELDKRKAAIVAYVLTGQCVADPIERRLIENVNRSVTAHLDSLKIATTAAPATQPDAA